MINTTPLNFKLAAKFHVGSDVNAYFTTCGMKLKVRRTVNLFVQMVSMHSQQLCEISLTSPGMPISPTQKT